MQTYNSKLAQEAQKLMRSSIDSLTLSIAVGALSSFDEYKYYAGRIAGLRDAVDLIDEASAIIDGKERS